MPIVYILTLLLITAVAPQCTPALYSRNITTQMLSFSAANIQNGAYTFTFTTAFSTLPQTALSITQITTTSPSALNSSSFFLTASPTTRAVRIMLTAVGSNWLVSRVCLWASTNRELLLGSAPISNSKPTSGSPPSLQFQIQIGSSLPVNNNQIARGFLNGLSCRGMLGSVTIASLIYSMGRITVNVNVNVEGGQVDALWISFVVFNLNNGEFAAYGGFTTINSNDSQTTDLMRGFSDPQNAIYGINAMRADQNRNGISLQMDMDSSFLLSYTSKMGSFVGSYIFIGYPANFTCLPCRTLMQNHYFNGNCLSQCPSDTLALTLSNGGQLCRGCPGGMVVVRGSCACPDGYAMQNGKCVSIVPVTNSMQGMKVQYSNYQESIDQSTSGTDQNSNTNTQSGAINILPPQNINQNLNFISNNQNNAANTMIMTTTASSSTSTNSFVFLPAATQGGQQFIPSTTANTQAAAQASSNMNVIYRIAASSCPIPNAFFNGYECVCFVGYIYSNGRCTILQIANPIIVPTPILLSPNTTQCPANSQFNGSTCVCVANYYLANNICTPRPICPPNSQDNGLGSCTCNNGFTMVNNVCQAVSTATIITCPPNSTLVGGTCVCNSGLYNISGACSPCPAQAYWSSQAQRCLFVCGVNAAYNQSVGGCACLNGFGRDSSRICTLCTGSFYVSNGYCVTCPANSQYNATSKQCLCMTGFLVTQQGICMQKCTSNQIYNPISTFCECIHNFTRIGTTCMPCPAGSFFSNGNCISCPVNSQLLGNKCICSIGFAADGFGVCRPCSALPNAFILNGLCVKCSNNMVFNVSSNTCECPMGKTRSGTLCISACNDDQLLDRNGNCYTCGMNEVISNGACVCQSGYTRNSCGICSLSCTENTFLFMGRCAMCPVNMNYMPAIGGCVCPNGYYMDPISNTCAVSTFIVPSCQSGTYYDNNAQRCLNCSANCAACTSNNSGCTACSRGYNLNNGVCVAICGDGVVVGSETCDTGSNQQPGCRQCRVVQGYSCVGQPSVCSLIQITINNTTPNTTTPSAPRLSLRGNISLNSNNIFISLLTNPTFTFPNPTIMQNFIQATYVNTLRPVTYCVQQTTNLNTFDCLLIYSSGVPNTKFNVLFSYNYQGQAANVTVTIDPLLYASSARTASPGSTTRSQ